jgi:hypothetical protein
VIVAGVVTAGPFVGVKAIKSSSLAPFLEQAASASSDIAQIAITIILLFNAVSLAQEQFISSLFLKCATKNMPRTI